MTERPILMSGPMVRAILDGRKTQTRRIIDQDLVELDDEGKLVFVHSPKCPGFCDYACAAEGETRRNHIGYSKYGQVGDRLWVRETFCDDYRWASEEDQSKIAYRADSIELPSLYKWKPSIHMPRWASRILLDITDVRVERLQEISEEDAKAEGCWLGNPKSAIVSIDPPDFRELWNSIYKNWEENPWVWVIEFKRIKP